MALNVGELYAQIKLDLTQFKKDINNAKKLLQGIGQQKGQKVQLQVDTKALAKAIENSIKAIAKNVAKELKIVEQQVKASNQKLLNDQKTNNAKSLDDHKTTNQKELSDHKTKNNQATENTKTANRIKVENTRTSGRLIEQVFRQQYATYRQQLANQQSALRAALRAQEQAIRQSFRQQEQARRQSLKQQEQDMRASLQRQRQELQQLSSATFTGRSLGISGGDIGQTISETFSVSTIITSLKVLFTTVLTGITASTAALGSFSAYGVQYNAELEMSFEALRYLVEDTTEKMTESYRRVMFEYNKLQGMSDTEATIKADISVDERGIMSSQELAQELFNQLKELSIQSPTLQFADVTQGTARLRNAGVEAGRLVKTIKAIGDGAAVTGKDAILNFDRATYAISQMYQKGGIYAEEFRKQLGNTGIATFSALSASTKLSNSTLAALMDKGLLKNKVKLKEIAAAVGLTVQELAKLLGDEKLTGESKINWVDKYIEGLDMVRGGAMDALANTFTGQINILAESWRFFAADVSKPLFKSLKGEIQQTTQYIKNAFGSDLTLKATQIFERLGALLSKLVDSIMPPAVELIKEFFSFINEEGNGIMFDLGEKIEYVGENLKEWVYIAVDVAKALWEVFTGTIETLVFIGKTLLFVGDMFNKVKENAFTLIPVVGWIVQLFVGFDTTASSLNESLEGLVELFLMLTTVIVGLKIGLFVAQLVFFIKNMAFGANAVGVMTTSLGLQRLAFLQSQLAIEQETIALARNKIARLENAVLRQVQMQSDLQAQLVGSSFVQRLALETAILRSQNKVTEYQNLIQNQNNTIKASGLRITQLKSELTAAETAILNGNTAAVNANTAANTRNAASGTAAGAGGVAAGAGAVAAGRGFGVAATGIRGFFAALGPVGIALTVITTALTFLIPAMVDFGDEGEKQAEKVKTRWEEVEEQIKATRERVEAGYVSSDVDVNIKTSVKEIDYTSLPQYRLDGTIQGPDMIVRVIKIEDVGSEVQKDVKEFSAEEIKRAEKKIKDLTTKLKGLEASYQATMKNLNNPYLSEPKDIAKTKEAIRLAEQYLAKLKKDPTGTVTPYITNENLKTALETTEGKAVKKIYESKTITKEEYNKIMQQIYYMSEKGQTGMDAVVEEELSKTRQGVKAKESFRQTILPKLIPGYVKNQNMGKVLNEMLQEGRFGSNKTFDNPTFKALVNDAMQGANEWMLADLMYKKTVSKGDRLVFQSKVKEWKPGAFTDKSKKGKWSPYDPSTDTSVDDLEVGAGDKPLTEYEKRKRAAEHAEGMKKSAEEIYNAWNYAYQARMTGETADDDLANERESKEKMLQFTEKIKERETDAIEKYQKKQEKIIKESYDKKREALRRYYDDVKSEEDMTSLQIQKTYYQNATSARGLAKLAEINKKIRDANREQTKEMQERSLEDEQDTQLTNLEKGTTDAINNVNKTKQTLTASIANFSSTVKGYTSTFYTLGANIAKAFNNGFKSVEFQFNPISPSSIGANKASAKVANASYDLANPAGLLAYGGTTTNFNSPIVSINNATFGDKLDATTFGQEVFRIAQKTTLATTGGRF